MSALFAVTVAWTALGWIAGAGPAGAGTGPVLVVMAHPDDEALGASGAIEQAMSAGRAVYVAIVTNGDSPTSGSDSGYCGAASGTPSSTARYGLTRDRETMAGMGLLGLQRTSTASTSHIFFLGYPDSSLTSIAASTSLYTGDGTALHRTYAEDGDGSNSTCNGDLRYLLSGSHSALTSTALAADLDSLLALTRPTDVYTHISTDGHPDHATVAKQVTAAIQRAGITVTVHRTLIHPEGSGSCMYTSAYEWPNPMDDGNPYDRFTPTLDVTAPPTPPCSTPTGSSWGSAGAPNEMALVPTDMQTTSESTNKKMQIILKYASQMICTRTSSGNYHPSCGYNRAFVKRHEWFWTTQVGPTGVPVNTGLPVITGTTVQGRTVSASTGSWTNSPTSYTYQWLDCDTSGAGCASISGATTSSYVLQSTDVGHTIRVRVVAKNAAGSSSPATSNATAVVTTGTTTSGTFGQTTVGNLQDPGGPGYIALTGRYGVTGTISIGKLTGYVSGGSATSRLRAVVYADNGGQPGAFLGVSGEVTVAAGQAAAWVTFALPAPVTSSAGGYWVGYWFADANSIHAYSSISGSGRWAPVPYSSTGNPPTVGGFNTSSGSYSLYASYTM